MYTVMCILTLKYSLLRSVGSKKCCCKQNESKKQQIVGKTIKHVQKVQLMMNQQNVGERK